MKIGNNYLSKKNSLKISLFSYIDASANIAYISLRKCGEYPLSKKSFQKLTFDLAKPAVEIRLSFFILQRVEWFSVP